VKIQVEVFWIVVPCSVAEDGGSKVIRNVGILPQHYTASQPRSPRPKILYFTLTLNSEAFWHPIVAVMEPSHVLHVCCNLPDRRTDKRADRTLQPVGHSPTIKQRWISSTKLFNRLLRPIFKSSACSKESFLIRCTLWHSVTFC